MMFSSLRWNMLSPLVSLARQPIVEMLCRKISPDSIDIIIGRMSIFVHRRGDIFVCKFYRIAP